MLSVAGAAVVAVADVVTVTIDAVGDASGVMAENSPPRKDVAAVNKVGVAPNEDAVDGDGLEVVERGLIVMVLHCLSNSALYSRFYASVVSISCLMTPFSCCSLFISARIASPSSSDIVIIISLDDLAARSAEG